MVDGTKGGGWYPISVCVYVCAVGGCAVWVGGCVCMWCGCVRMCVYMLCCGGVHVVWVLCELYPSTLHVVM